MFGSHFVAGNNTASRRQMMTDGMSDQTGSDQREPPALGGWTNRHVFATHHDTPGGHPRPYFTGNADVHS